MDAHPQYVPIQLEEANLNLLLSFAQIYIKQKMDLIEILGICEKKNVYYVYGGQAGEVINPKELKHKMPIFKCKEKSSCIQRHCLPADCHAFEMKVSQYLQVPEQQQMQHQDKKQKGNDDDKELVMKFDRPYKCTWLCLNRPIMDVYAINQGAAVKFGSIVQQLIPCLCCEVGVIINDKNEQQIYRVIGSACQLAFFCNMPCKACQTVYFKIFNTANQIVGELVKESAGCGKACLSDADYFRIVFPPDATVEQRAMLLAAALFIDYNYFETSPADEMNKNG